ncbi:hypothetical protein CVT26_011555 [Gymnopilus dilepis]|uniref:Uncharacterized protein n=1 Tax=Gymnopilus dilepis TaxID=231916 RepID=A0A409W940_9AGAR|nr:hypothetical protein CVT26_011555 [Gymnopilus dilepis]
MASFADGVVRIWDIPSGECLLTQNVARNREHESLRRCFFAKPDPSFGVAAGGEKLQTLMTKVVVIVITNLGTRRGVEFSLWKSQVEQQNSGTTRNITDLFALKEILRVVSSRFDFESAAWDAVGNTVAIGGHDASIHLWDSSTAEHSWTLLGHSKSVQHLLLDQDRLCSTSSDQTIRIWDTHTGDCFRILSISSADFETRNLGVSSSHIVSYHDRYHSDHRIERFLVRWDVNSGEVMYKIHLPPRLTTSQAGVKVYIDEDKIILGENDTGCVSIWGLQSGNPIGTFFVEVEEKAFAPYFFRLESGRCLRFGISTDNLGGCHTLDVGNLVFDDYNSREANTNIGASECGFRKPADETLGGDVGGAFDPLVGFHGREVIIESEPRYSRRLSCTLFSMSMSPPGLRNPRHFSIPLPSSDGRQAFRHPMKVECTQNHCVVLLLDVIHVYSLPNFVLRHSLQGQPGENIKMLGVYEDLIMAVSWNGVRIWDSHSGECLITQTIARGLPLSVFFVRQSLVGNSDALHGSVRRTEKWSREPMLLEKIYEGELIRAVGFRIWKVDTGQQNSEKIRNDMLESPFALKNILEVSSEFMAWDADGNTVAIASDDNTIRLWDITRKECRWILIGHSDYASRVCLDQDKVYSVSHDQTIRIWDVNTGDCHRVFRFSEEIQEIGISSCHLVSYHDRPHSDLRWERGLDLWDVKSGEHIYKIDLPSDGFFRLAQLYVDDKKIALGEDFGRLSIWDLPSGRPIGILSSGHYKPLFAHLCFDFRRGLRFGISEDENHHFLHISEFMIDDHSPLELDATGKTH